MIIRYAFWAFMFLFFAYVHKELLDDIHEQRFGKAIFCMAFNIAGYIALMFVWPFIIWGYVGTEEEALRSHLWFGAGLACVLGIFILMTLRNAFFYLTNGDRKEMIFSLIAGGIPALYLLIWFAPHIAE